MTQNDNDTILARLDGLSARVEDIANDVATLAESVGRLLSLLEPSAPGLSSAMPAAASPAMTVAALANSFPPMAALRLSDQSYYCFAPTMT